MLMSTANKVSKGITSDSDIGSHAYGVRLLGRFSSFARKICAKLLQMVGKRPRAQNEWPNSPVTGTGISEEWNEFVTDRLGELKPQQDMNETKWALGVVDFIDELKESDNEASIAERDLSAKYQRKLLTILESQGFSIIDSDEWNPDRQRAVAVMRKPDAAETKILGKGSTGLSLNGKIIRKQEVKIEMKGN